VTPSSIRDVEAMMPIVYGFGWSYGKIWSVLSRAERRAKALLDLVDLTGIKTISPLAGRGYSSESSSKVG